MIHANPLSDVFTSVSRASDYTINKLPGFLFVATLTATVVLVAAGQTNSFQPAATPSFQGLGQMPGVWPAAGTYASGISGDGSTIMGYGWVCANGGSSCNSSDTVLAYRWTVTRGYQILGSRGGSDFFGAGAGGGGCSYQGLQCIRTGLPCFPVDARRRAAGPRSDHRHGQLCDCHLRRWLGDRGGGPGREWLLAGVSLERLHWHGGCRHSRRPGERRIRCQ